MQRTIKTYGAAGQYIEYLPNPGVPVRGKILFFHGLGEVGTNISLVERNEIPKQLKEGMEVPYIVIAPQLRSGNGWPKNVIMDMLRIYDKYEAPIKLVTGLSLGGAATFGAIVHAYEFNGNKPGYFFAAGVICGFVSQNDPEDMFPYIGTKMKTFHGTGDTTVRPGSVRTFVNNFKAAGGDVEQVEYEGLNHQIWDEAYSPTRPEGWWAWLEKIVPPIGDPQPTPKDPVTETYYQDGKLNFVTISGKTYTVIPEN